MSDSPAFVPPNTAPAPVMRTGRLRRLWRWGRRWGKRLTLLTLLAAVGGAVVYAMHRQIAFRTGAQELDAARAAVERDDSDWKWEQLNAARPHPPEGRNGAELIARIKNLTSPEWLKLQADPHWESTLDAEPNRRLPRDLLDAIRAQLAASTDAVTLARTMRDRPWGHRDVELMPNVLDTPLEDTQATAYAAVLLRWDAAVAAEDADPGRAADDLLALLRISRSIGDEPMLISQMFRIAARGHAVRAAARVLAHTPDAAGLDQFQAALAADLEEPLLLYGMRGQRATFDRLFENLTTGAVSPGDGLDRRFDDLHRRFEWWHYRPHLPADRAYALGWMTRCVDVARLPIHEQPAAFAALSVLPKSPDRLVSRLLLPEVYVLARAYWRSTVEARCAVAGIACERFRQQHGRWHDTLAELVPTFLPAVPLDPFTGEPLRFAKRDRGAVVYSVGPDRSGAGATLDPDSPHWPPAPRFRLWNPDRRRLPPIEPPPAEPDP